MPPKNSRELRRSALSWLLRSLLGSPLRSIRLANSGIELAGGKPRQVHFADMTAPARQGGSGAIVFQLASGSEMRASGFTQTEVPAFVQAVNLARQRCICDLFEHAQTELSALAHAKQRLDRPRRYPAACVLKMRS